MIAALGEGFPFTSVRIRNEVTQEAVGAFGLLLAMIGVYLGFSFGVKNR
jgi:hypothetical protein